MVQLPRPGLENNQGINVKNRNRTPLPNRNDNIPVRITRNHKSSEIPTVTNLVNIQITNSREKPNTTKPIPQQAVYPLESLQILSLKWTHLPVWTREVM